MQVADIRVRVAAAGGARNRLTRCDRYEYITLERMSAPSRRKTCSRFVIATPYACTPCADANVSEPPRPSSASNSAFVYSTINYAHSVRVSVLVIYWLSIASSMEHMATMVYGRNITNKISPTKYHQQNITSIISQEIISQGNNIAGNYITRK